MHMSDMSQAGCLQGKLSETNAAGKRLFSSMSQHMPLKHPLMSEDFGASETRMDGIFLNDHLIIDSSDIFRQHWLRRRSLWYFKRNRYPMLWVIILSSLQFLKVDNFKGEVFFFDYLEITQSIRV